MSTQSTITNFSDGSDVTTAEFTALQNRTFWQVVGHISIKPKNCILTKPRKFITLHYIYASNSYTVIYACWTIKMFFQQYLRQEHDYAIYS